MNALNVGNIVVVRGTTLAGQILEILDGRALVRFMTGVEKCFDLHNLVKVDAMLLR